MAGTFTRRVLEPLVVAGRARRFEVHDAYSLLAIILLDVLDPFLPAVIEVFHAVEINLQVVVEELAGAFLIMDLHDAVGDFALEVRRAAQERVGGIAAAGCSE